MISNKALEKFIIFLLTFICLPLPTKGIIGNTTISLSSSEISPYLKFGFEEGGTIYKEVGMVSF